MPNDLFAAATSVLEAPESSPALKTVAAKSLLTAMGESLPVPARATWLVWSWSRRQDLFDASIEDSVPVACASGVWFFSSASSQGAGAALVSAFSRLRSRRHTTQGARISPILGNLVRIGTPRFSASVFQTSPPDSRVAIARVRRDRFRDSELAEDPP
jgi:hypothetical protein